jgi:hypothetical protein
MMIFFSYVLFRYVAGARLALPLHGYMLLQNNLHCLVAGLQVVDICGQVADVDDVGLAADESGGGGKA